MSMSAKPVSVRVKLTFRCAYGDFLAGESASAEDSLAFGDFQQRFKSDENIFRHAGSVIMDGCLRTRRSTLPNLVHTGRAFGGLDQRHFRRRTEAAIRAKAAMPVRIWIEVSSSNIGRGRAHPGLLRRRAPSPSAATRSALQFARLTITSESATKPMLFAASA